MDTHFRGITSPGGRFSELCAEDKAFLQRVFLTILHTWPRDPIPPVD